MNHKKPGSSPDLFWKEGIPNECMLPVLIDYMIYFRKRDIH